MIRDLFRRLAFAAWAAQAGLVLAAQQVMSPDTIPAIQWLYTLLLALAGGAAATLTRYASGAPTERWKLELARDVICSALAGVLALFAGLYFEVKPLLAAIAIALSGWGGSKALEWAFQRLQKRAERLLGEPAEESKP